MTQYGFSFLIYVNHTFLGLFFWVSFSIFYDFPGVRLCRRNRWITVNWKYIFRRYTFCGKSLGGAWYTKKVLFYDTLVYWSDFATKPHQSCDFTQFLFIQFSKYKNLSSINPTLIWERKYIHCSGIVVFDFYYVYHGTWFVWHNKFC